MWKFSSSISSSWAVAFTRFFLPCFGTDFYSRHWGLRAHFAQISAQKNSPTFQQLEISHQLSSKAARRQNVHLCLANSIEAALLFRTLCKIIFLSLLCVRHFMQSHQSNVEECSQLNLNRMPAKLLHFPKQFDVMHKAWPGLPTFLMYPYPWTFLDILLNICLTVEKFLLPPFTSD